MRSKTFIISAIVLCAAVLLFSGYQIGSALIAGHKAEKQFADAAAQIYTPEMSVTSDSLQFTSIPLAPSESTELPAPVWTVDDQYGRLFNKNPKMIGWISIDGTTINYPVMQTDNNSFYLTHGLDGTHSNHGVPFIDARCDIYAPSDNIMIYSHHMKDGTMFADLEKYKQESYYHTHPIIEFDTRTGFGTYQIIAVFKVNPANFPFNDFVDASNGTSFDAYVSRCKALSFYDTGVTAVYGDKLITLSTCEYSQAGNRLAVVAKRVFP